MQEILTPQNTKITDSNAVSHFLGLFINDLQEKTRNTVEQTKQDITTLIETGTFEMLIAFIKEYIRKYGKEDFLRSKSCMYAKHIIFRFLEARILSPQDIKELLVLLDIQDTSLIQKMEASTALESNIRFDVSHTLKADQANQFCNAADLYGAL